MRILFVCAAGLGHVHPLIPLARAAVAAGDEVLFATAAEGVAAIERLGFPAVAVPAGDPGEVAAAWARLPDRDVNTYVVADIFVRIQGRAALPAQRALIEDFGADLVVSAELGALVAAQASGTPSAYVGITALDLDDLDLDRVVAAIDDLRAVAGLPRSGRLPFPDEAAYLSPVPPTLWADQHMSRRAGSGIGTRMPKVRCRAWFPTEGISARASTPRSVRWPAATRSGDSSSSRCWRHWVDSTRT